MPDLEPGQLLDALREEREGIFASVQEIADRFSEEMTPENASTFGISVARLESLQNEFTNVQARIIRANYMVPQANRISTDASRKALTGLVDSAQRLYLRKSRSTAQAAPAPAPRDDDEPSTQIKLSKLELPTFRGKIEEWSTFYNVFGTAVHANPRINTTDKFRYLLTHLEGEPASLVRTLNFDPANYEKAWEELTARYNSERRHVSLHFNSLLDLPELTHDSTMSTFLARLQEHTHALATLKYKSADYGPMLVTVILRKMPHYHRKRFEDFREDSQKHPTYEELLDFLRNECTRLDDLPQESFYSRSNGHKKPNKTLHASASSTAKPTRSTSAPSQKRKKKSPPPCPSCNQPHYLMHCQDFTSKDFPQRKKMVSSLNRCRNCLGDHPVAGCPSKKRCRFCNADHHSLLCHSSTEHSSGSSFRSSPKVLMGTASTDEPTVLLATVQLRIKTQHGSVKVRGILDSASQGSLLTTRIARQIRAQISPSDTTVSGISQADVAVRGSTNIDIWSRTFKEVAHNLPVVVIDHITGHTPDTNISPQIRQQFKDLFLADPQFDRRGPIDLLIGADLYPYLLNGRMRTFGRNLPVALGTMMGYVLLGNTPAARTRRDNAVTTLLTTRDHELHETLQKFWQIEEPPRMRPPPPAEEDPAEVHYKNTTQRAPDGRFIVRLPFHTPPEVLGESQRQALRRFKALEFKFRGKPDFKPPYVKFMKDFFSDGFMKEAPPDVLNGPHFFLPHHEVVKTTSSTTKLRCVFDASAKTSSGKSLNDLLHVGPKLVKDIREVLLNFRVHRVVFACDIKQMYLQVCLHSDDQRFHLMYWRPDENQPIRIYMLTTVTFGVASSSFLAIRPLQQLAQDHREEFPNAAKIIEEGLYVDNFFAGAASVEEAIEHQKELVQLLDEGKFVARKYLSNEPSLLQGLPPDYLEEPVMWEDKQTSSLSILGIQWIPAEDNFTYKVQLPQAPKHTKRTILSAISTVFDPKGWVSPVVFVIKSLLQQLWLLKIDWDTPVPEHVAKIWTDFKQELPRLSEIRVPRFLQGGVSGVQIHGFADASELGTSCVAYIRSEISPRVFQVQLVTAKAKVAPLKRISMPRLELCATALLIMLLDYLVPQLSKSFQVEKVYAWSDSTNALQWIQTPSYRLKTFVGNRVAYIQETLPSAIWGHVRSEDHPADYNSRGLMPSKIRDTKLWWLGPEWLSLPEEDWPQQVPVLPPLHVPEAKRTVLIVSSAQHEVFQRFSSWDKLQRVLAYVLRFIHNLARPKQRRSGPLARKDFAAAERLTIRRIQLDAFPDEFELLQDGAEASRRMAHLSPFIDHHGLIRVGGRLLHAGISDDKKHPWVLPKKHPLVQSLIDERHKDMHYGAQQLLFQLRQRYWILSGRTSIRSVVAKCIPCFRVRPRNTAPLMADLPSVRVTPATPFSRTGLDYAGPYDTKIHTLRFAKTIKTYLCIFICTATRAVHIEIAEDLTADSFIAALTRFASRRGAPVDLYSDCGTNFVGASNELKRVVQQLQQQLPTDPTTARFAQQHGTNFHFNPPAAPHQGGLWQAAVKSAKSGITRVTHGQLLTLSEFQTLCAWVEAMLNSRPITPVSSDPNDLQPLTPAHFLIGRPLTAIPEPQYDDDVAPAKRWHRVQAFAQSIWRRWSNEYLQTLTSKGKWTKDQPRTLQVNDLVLVHEPNAPPLCWTLGRISAVHPGSDGRVRVATVRTSTGELKRPALKLYPLPLN